MLFARKILQYALLNNTAKLNAAFSKVKKSSTVFPPCKAKLKKKN